MRPRQRWNQGFTLMEMMVTVAILATIAVMALASFSKARLRDNLDGFSKQIVAATHMARQRAINTLVNYIVNVTQTGVQWCQQDPTVLNTSCPTASSTNCTNNSGGACENGRLFTAASQAQIAYYATTADTGQNPTKVAISTGTVFYCGYTGTCDATANSTTPRGFTIYLQDSVNTNIQDEVVILPYGRSHVLTSW